jgi:hypothetical protein
VVSPSPSADAQPAGMSAGPAVQQPAVQPAETPQAIPPGVAQLAPPAMSPEEEMLVLKRQGIQVMLPYALRNSDPAFCAGLAFDAISSGNIDVLRIFKTCLRQRTSVHG